MENVKIVQNTQEYLKMVNFVSLLVYVINCIKSPLMEVVLNVLYIVDNKEMANYVNLTHVMMNKKYYQMEHVKIVLNIPHLKMTKKIVEVIFVNNLKF